MKFEHFKILRDQALAACTEDGKKYPLPQEVPTLLLALIGDAVYSLYVRTRLLPASTQVRVVHTLAARMVSAVMQAKATDELLAEKYFTDEEESILRRGRNTKSIAPKSASVREYRQSTAFEALMGFLLLAERYDRLENFAARSFEIIAAIMREEKAKNDKNGKINMERKEI